MREIVLLTLSVRTCDVFDWHSVRFRTQFVLFHTSNPGGLWRHLPSRNHRGAALLAGFRHQTCKHCVPFVQWLRICANVVVVFVPFATRNLIVVQSESFDVAVAVEVGWWMEGSLS